MITSASRTRYKYRLGKLTGRCPQCGRRTFKYYLDASGHPLDPECGRCNREIKCAYHRPPRMMGLSQSPAEAAHRPTPRQKQRPMVRRIERWRVHHMRCTSRTVTPLHTYLCELFPRHLVNKAASLYHLGLKPNGLTPAIVWWMIDHRNEVRSGKIMTYRSDGHRCRDGAKAGAMWVHSDLRIADFDYQACFFGSHLLAQRPDAPVVVVESEKTALMLELWALARGKEGEYVFIATGGRSMANCDLMEIDNPDYRWHPLQGRHLILVPDCDNVDAWATITQNRPLRMRLNGIELVDLRERGGTGSQDAADLLENSLRRPHII